MPLTNLGWGRKEICEQCEHWVVRVGDKFPHCEASATRKPIDYDHLNGDSSNCPIAVKWKNVIEKDVPQIAATAREEALAKAATDAKKLLTAFGVVPEAEESIRTALTTLVENGNLTAEIAAQVETDLIEDKRTADVA